MKFLFTALLTLGLLTPTFAQAEEAASGDYCRARSIEKYYCPTHSGWWWGPYYDGGCSVRCPEGQKATCEEASCADDHSGEAVPSSCTCA